MRSQELVEVLGQRFGGPFARAGLVTVGDLIDAIEVYKLKPMDHNMREFYFASPLCSIYIRMAGPKTWKAALDFLEEKCLFPWRQHVVGQYGSIDPMARFNLQIQEAMSRLLYLLEEWHKRLNNHKE